MWNIDLGGDALAALLVSIVAHLTAVVSYIIRLRRRQIQSHAGRQHLSIFYRKRSDLYMLCAFFISIGNSICIWIEVRRASDTRGIFANEDSRDPGAETEDLLLAEYISELFYALSNGAAKLSIAFFLVELTPELDFERVVLHILAGLAASWTVVFVVTSLFQCIPPSDAWKDGRQGNCLDHVALRIAQRTMSVFVDLMLLASSAKLMWPAPILSCSRVAYFSSIGAGTLVCACALYWTAMYSTWMKHLEKAERYQHLLWPAVELYLRIAWGNLPFLSNVYAPYA